MKDAEAHLAATRQEEALARATGDPVPTLVHVYMHVYACMHMHAHTHMYTYVYIYTCVYIHVHMCYARIMWCSMRACLRVVCVTTPSTPPSTNE